MADINNRWMDNTNGKFYVDDQCIDCNVCREIATGFFKRNEDFGYSYIYKQPLSKKDIKLCLQALNCCPVEAIGKDGFIDKSS